MPVTLRNAEPMNQVTYSNYQINGAYGLTLPYLTLGVSYLLSSEAIMLGAMCIPDEPGG